MSECGNYLEIDCGINQFAWQFLRPTANNATKKLVSTTRHQVAGFIGNDVARQQKTDLGNAPATNTTTVDRTNCLTQIVSSHAVYSGTSTSVSRAGRPTRSRGPADTPDTVTTYDALGRVATVQRPGISNPQITTYQTGKARVGTVQAPHGLLTTYLYGNAGATGAGQITEIQTAGSGTVFSFYDLHGRLKRKSGARTYPVEYSYDPTYGEMKTLTTWQNYSGNTGIAVTTWNYDPATGLLLSKVDADQKATSYTYDIASRLVTRTDALNVVTTYHYDNLQKDLTSLTYSDGTPTVNQDYDRLGRPGTTTTGTVARLVRTYSPSHLGEENQTITYDTNGNGTFDAADLARVLTRQYADAVMTARNSGYTLAPAGVGAEAIVEYAFEPVAGRIQDITVYSEVNGTLGSLFRYAYEPARPHLIKTVTSPAHVVTNTWEPNRDVLDIKENKQGTTNRSTYNYTVNPLGQRTAVQTTGYTGGSWNWEYDNLGQVKKADNTTANSLGTSADRAYLYDDIGNWKNAQDGIIAIPSGTPPTYTANSLNQYTAINASVPAYDLAGNLTSDGGANGTNTSRSYFWDAEQRLKEVKNTAAPQTVLATYRYDAFHRRISKTVGTTTTWFIYDGWNLIAEYTSSAGSSPVLNKLHHWGLDLSATFQGAGGVGGLLATDLLDTSVVGLSARYYPTYDGNGNVSEYLRGTLPSVPRFTYDPFGRIIVPSTNPWAPHLSFRFSTKYRDEETEFYYYGYRYYSALLGRWINRDPIGERGGMNLYGMVGNSVVNKYDYLGYSSADLVTKLFGGNIKKAYGIDVTANAVAGIGPIAGGFQLVFFPDSCELGFYGILPAIVDPDGNGKIDTLAPADPSKLGAVKNAVKNLPIGLDISASTNFSIAANIGANSGPESWTGLFYGGTADLGVGAAIGAGVFWDPGGNWVGGSVGVGASVLPFNAKTNPQAYFLLKKTGLSCSVCYALTYLVP